MSSRLQPRFVVLWVKFCGHNYPSILDPGEWRETQHNLAFCAKLISKKTFGRGVHTISQNPKNEWSHHHIVCVWQEVLVFTIPPHSTRAPQELFLASYNLCPHIHRTCVGFRVSWDISHLELSPPPSSYGCTKNVLVPWHLVTQLCIDQGSCRLAPIGGSPYGPKEHFAK